MNPIVSIIMGSTSDLPVMEKAARFLEEMEVPFEMNALSAHRTPAEVDEFARGAAGGPDERRRAHRGESAMPCRAGCGNVRKRSEVMRKIRGVNAGVGNGGPQFSQ